MQLLETLSQTALILWVAESDWGYPIVLTLHSIGMALAIGIVAMFDLRVLGLATRVSLAAFDPFFRVAWLGLAINVASGTLLFCANYSVFLHNTAFITKLTLLAAAALVTWLLARSLHRARAARGFAMLGLVLLFAAITAGRIIGYTSVPE